MSDVHRIVVGLNGTLLSFSLVSLESVAAIAAGLATAVFMIVSVYFKIKNKG